MRDLGAIWLYVADSSCRGYSPIYDRICRTVAESDEVLDLVSEAPPRRHNPVLLLAAVHYLVLGGLDHPLAAVYAERRRRTRGRCSSTFASTTARPSSSCSPPAR